MSDPEFKWDVVEASSLTPGPVRHEVLPDWFVVRARLVHGIVGDALGMPLAKFLEGFQRDRDPVSELAIWERMALVILDLSRTRDVTPGQKKSVLSTLLLASNGGPASELFGKSSDLSPEVREAAVTAAKELGFG